MELRRLFGSVFPMIAAIGCQAADERAPGEASAYIGTTSTIPADAACAHVVATRLADFAVSEYQGPLSGGVFSVLPGDTRVTATAFPPPCSAEPGDPPWIADEQIAAFTSGANTLTLRFHDSTSVAIDPTFDDNTAPQVVLAAGSPVRTGRNGEDAAGPNYALDGWEVKQLALPPAAPGETVLFTMQGKGALTATPRGLAALPDGTFMAQLGEPAEPLRRFSAAGDFLEAWPVIYPPTATRFDFTDGVEAIDATHLVRTGYLNTPTGCDSSGANCRQAGLEILALATAIDGSRELHVARQLFLPELPGLPLNAQYPLAVTPVGAGFAVISIPNDGSPQQLVLLDGDGAVVAGPAAVTGSIEGLFVAADGRLGALDYRGHLTMHDAGTLAERPGETAFYKDGVDLSTPSSLAWNSATGSFLALSQDNRLVSLSPALSAATDLGIDLSAYASPSGLDYLADTDQVAIADRLPPIDPATGKRIPRVDFYDLSTRTLVTTTTLQGIALPVRTVSIAYVPGRRQIVSHYRRPGGTADAAVDAVAYTHDLGGALVGTFDLAPFGFRRIQAISYLPSSDELVITASDASGVERLIVTSPTGKPRRSYRLDAIGDAIDVAPITSGPGAGDLGAVENQPSNFFQLSLR